jgi:hypothetical protein
VDVAFEVSGSTYTVPERQATILSENLRLFGKGEFPEDVQRAASLGASADWRDGARATADWIDSALNGEPDSLPLEGKAAEATYWALVLMVGIGIAPDPSGATGLRDALGALLAY